MANCPPGRQQQLQKLLFRLGLSDTVAIQWQLLDLALTHPTVSPTANYEQLEFMGDAVVKLFVADLLWRLDPEGTVGQWSAIRSVLVSDRTLAEVAQSYGLERFLQIAPSAARDVQGLESRLADALEALLGALYLSTADFSLIRPWLEPHLQRRAATVRSDPAYQNYKAALQEWTQAQYKILPEYRVQAADQPIASTQTAATLENHRFTAEVWLQDQCLAIGTGRSIKAAEKAAAEIAFQRVHTDPNLIASGLVQPPLPEE